LDPKKTSVFIMLLSSLWTVNGCSASETDGESDGARRTWYRPAAATTWQWQLSGRIDTSYRVDLYDIDLFDTPRTIIDTLHAQGKKVICYFSAGSYEAWREDADRFPAEVLGKPLEGWAQERWLDIGNLTALAPIMRARLDRAAAKGCDGVEPDNVDGYVNDTGFALTFARQIAYNTFLADEAHRRGLAIGLKNDPDQIAELVDRFDFALNEECNAYDECDKLQPFLDRNKPVFNAEYDTRYITNGRADPALCRKMNARGIHTLVLPIELDDRFRYSCEPDA
jgi:hypothetical protein